MDRIPVGRIFFVVELKEVDPETKNIRLKAEHLGSETEKYSSKDVSDYVQDVIDYVQSRKIYVDGRIHLGSERKNIRRGTYSITFGT